ncbi:hypothetical protein ACMT9U_07465 [Clavibacter sp. Sh2036]|uniref:hypothetical protein n=1 Tax=Clavibacter sp. Sh2036 TaxID=3397677 RepID=UPI0039DFCA07
MSPSFSDWQAVLAVAISALGLIATLYTAFGSTARRLRNDVTIDQKIVADLEGAASDDLQESINNRAYRLVAATQYPSLTWYEVALAFLLTPIFWLLYGTPGDIDALAAKGEVAFELTGPGQLMALFIAFVIYAAVLRSWSGRAAARVVYVYKRLGDDEARAFVRLLAFPAYLVPTAFVSALSFSMLLNIRAIAQAIDWPLGVAILLTVAVCMLLIFITIHLASRERLSKYVNFYTDVMHSGSDIPRLRPPELGQTPEDVTRYKQASERRFPSRQRSKQDRNRS